MLKLIYALQSLQVMFFTNFARRLRLLVRVHVVEGCFCQFLQIIFPHIEYMLHFLKVRTAKAALVQYVNQKLIVRYKAEKHKIQTTREIYLKKLALVMHFYSFK